MGYIHIYLVLAINVWQASSIESNINQILSDQILIINFHSPHHRPVNTGLLNEKKQAPIHLATELNNVQALRVMGKYRKDIDIKQGGEHGRTALHLAAIYDHEECARILVSKQLKLNICVKVEFSAEM